MAQQEGERALRRSGVIDVLSARSASSSFRCSGGSPSVARRRIDINPYDDVSFPLGLSPTRCGESAFVTIIEGLERALLVLRLPYTAGTSGRGRRQRSWPTFVRPSTPVTGKCTYWGKSSTTTRRQTMRAVTLHSFFRRSTTSPASSGFDLRVLIRVTPGIV